MGPTNSEMMDRSNKKTPSALENGNLNGHAGELHALIL